MNKEPPLQMRVVVLTCDKPTANGRVYPSEVVDKMIRDARRKIKNKTLFGALGSDGINSDGTLDMRKLSHRVIRIIKHRGKMKGVVSADIQSLFDMTRPTAFPNAYLLENFKRAGMEMQGVSCSVGTLTKGNVVKEAKFTSINIALKDKPNDSLRNSGKRKSKTQM